ncbi:hypothetical protein ACFWZ2_29015 [Streptomyces sp. NPDC059002]|uniref:hypothetical protein n=1 Tax=Streptomyces sp. NPDC059002 TaxID=3346690 RepID=UPI0036A41E94
MADLPAEPGQDGAGAAAEGPVFVDETGRRGRRYRRVGMVVGIACAVYAVIIVGTLLSGNSSAPWLPVQGPDDDRPASKVDTPDRPADAIAPSVSSGTTPSPGGTDEAGGTAEPGATGGPDPSADGDTGGRPGTSADPDPTDDGRPDPGPGPTGDGGPDPDPTGATTDPDPDPTTPTDPPTGPPTQSPEPGGNGGNGDGGGGGGGGEVPVGYTSPATQSASGAQSSSGDARR